MGCRALAATARTWRLEIDPALGIRQSICTVMTRRHMTDLPPYKNLSGIYDLAWSLWDRHYGFVHRARLPRDISRHASGIGELRSPWWENNRATPSVRRVVAIVSSAIYVRTPNWMTRRSWEN